MGEFGGWKSAILGLSGGGGRDFPLGSQSVWLWQWNSTSPGWSLRGLLSSMQFYVNLNVGKLQKLLNFATKCLWCWNLTRDSYEFGECDSLSLLLLVESRTVLSLRWGEEGAKKVCRNKWHAIVLSAFNNLFEFNETKTEHIRLCITLPPFPRPRPHPRWAWRPE